MLEITSYVVGVLQTNCYIVYDNCNKMAIIIDPGAKDEKLTKKVKSMISDGVKFKYILLTHGHFDHISAVAFYKRLTKSSVVISEEEKDFTSNSRLNLSIFFSSFEVFSADIFVKNAMQLEFAGNKITVYATPGHTAGGVCYLLEDNLFTGDTLMKSVVGRSDLPTGDKQKLEESLNKIFQFKTNLKIYPGHGEKTDLFTEKMKV